MTVVKKNGIIQTQGYKMQQRDEERKRERETEGG